MESNQIGRRDFLKLGAIAGVATTATAAFPKISLGCTRAAKLDKILAMTPLQMAQKSKVVQDGFDFLQYVSKTIRNRTVRGIVGSILASPAPTFAARLQDQAAKQAVYYELIDQGYLASTVTIDQFLPPTDNPLKSAQPFWSSPGSTYSGHHAYPGGLVTHTALNVNSSLGLYEGYRSAEVTTVDRDIVVTSQTLHDLLKPWVYPWLSDGSSRPEVSIAGTGEHHIYSIAESIYRGLPAEYCVAQACAHNHPGDATDEAQVVNWIKAACILLGVEPVDKGLLSDSADTVPVPRRIENFICHLGDHDWVLMGSVASWMVAQLKTIAADQYGMTDADLAGSKFNAFRNYIFSQATDLYLYNLYSTEGFDALVEKVLDIVTPA